jgi:hypothetical protein
MMTLIGGFIIKIIGARAASFLISPLGIALIAGVVLVLSNLFTGIHFYLEGRNDMAAKCKTASYQKRISELERDTLVQKGSAAFHAERAKILADNLALREQKVADYEAELAQRSAKPECRLTPADLGSGDGVRASRARR